VKANHTISGTNLSATTVFSDSTDTWDRSAQAIGVLAPPTDITINGPMAGLTNTAYTFTADVEPEEVTQPVTYTWQASEQSLVTHTSGLSDTAVFTWSVEGNPTITVTAANNAGFVTDTFSILITTSPNPVEKVDITGPTAGVIDTEYTFNAQVSPVTATYPITYEWYAKDQLQATQVNGLNNSFTFAWDTQGPKTITVIATNAPGEEADTVFSIRVTDSPQTPTNVDIVGAQKGAIGKEHVFSASVEPEDTTQPVTYTWEATEQSRVVNVGYLSDTVKFSWNELGPQTITLTAANLGGAISDTHRFTVASLSDLQVTPESLSFTAVEEGSNPQSRYITIDQSGGDELNWNANESASWLTISPTIGTTPSTLTASVNITGLMIGTYSDTLAITSDAAGNSPQMVSVVLHIKSGTVFLPLVLRDWPPIPGKPTLHAINNPSGQGSYTVQWSSADDQAAYYILEEANSSDFKEISNIHKVSEVYSGTNTSYNTIDKNAARYYYRVKAYNEWGESDWSTMQPVDVQWEAEGNDSSSAANGPLVSGLDYYGYPDDGDPDYYSIYLSTGGDISIILTDHASDGVWLQLWNEDLSNELGLTKDGPPYRVEASNVPAGVYYVRVWTAEGSGQGTPYTLRTTFP
jgi:hypothetical protein